MKSLFWIFSLIMLEGCVNNENSVSHFNRIVDGKKEGSYIDYYPDGTIKSILNYKRDSLNGESVRYYDNGHIRTKVYYINNIENGMAYYFYKSGVIECVREWENGKKVGYAEDYYDTSGIIKSYMFYNNEGFLLWRNTVDTHGKIIKEEGKENKL